MCMCVRDSSLVPRSHTCCALSHAALTNRGPRRQPFVTYHHRTGLGGVPYPAKQLTDRLCTSSRLSAVYAEMMLLLNGNQDHIPAEVPALSTEQASQAVPRRLSHPRAEVVANSTGEAENGDAYDEYEGESSSLN